MSKNVTIGDIWPVGLNWKAVGLQPWWCHDNERFCALLSLCEDNPPVTGGFPHKWPVMLVRMILWFDIVCYHYSDVIMRAIAIVYSSVYSGADQRKHQSSASLAFVQGIHRWPMNSPYKWPVTQKNFPIDDVIMIEFKSLRWTEVKRSMGEVLHVWKPYFNINCKHMHRNVVTIVKLLIKLWNLFLITWFLYLDCLRNRIDSTIALSSSNAQICSERRT